MEFGGRTGTRIGADPRARGASGSHRALTGHILGMADGAGYGAALIDAAEGTMTTWPQFAQTVRAAADGLRRRGLRVGDTVGIFVADAASHVVAVQAVRAAGATARPVRPAPTADIAAELAACRARLLITSASLAEVAVQAAERSWVRQVFAFGEAPGTTPFGTLLETAESAEPQANGRADWARRPGTMPIPDPARFGQASGLRLTPWDVVVAGPPCGDPAAYTSLLDLALIAGATIVAAPADQITAAVDAYHGTAAIVLDGTRVEGIPAAQVFGVG